MGAINTFVDFFQAGGDFMFPVLITLLVGAAIASERYIKLTRVMYHNKRIWLSIQPLLASGDFAQAQQLINIDNSEISGVLRRCLKRQGEIQQRDDIDFITSENMLEISPQLNKRTHYVALLANISTLFGLLGTIVGLINAFTAVAKADASEKIGRASCRERVA